MPIDRDDIQASVSSGLITEEQAAGIIALAEEREGIRQSTTGVDEPFELFKGFNEVFIIAGLTLLYLGWNGLTLAFGTFRDFDFVSRAIWPGVISLATLFWLANYFTLKRRMVGPSNAIVVMTTISAFQLGVALFARFFLQEFELGDTFSFWTSVSAIFTPAFMIAILAMFWIIYRVPSTLFAIALSVYLLVFGITRSAGAELTAFSDLFTLTASGPFAYLTILLGLIGFGIAMWFDMKDPHRVTRHAKNAFWLHIVAAPAIVNTVALTLFLNGGAAATGLLVIFLIFITVLALVVDRRSFLMSGIIYVIALAASIDEGSTVSVMLVLGLGLVGIGSQWAWLRNKVMTVLPYFPGKNRLPPWAQSLVET
ncbi:MAG: hypothetical protein AAF826_07275 [Pseudomonadota bacterium]